MNKQRYLLAVYLFFFVLSLLILTISIIYDFNEPKYNDILLNLGTELFAVVIIFFFINKIFLLEKWDLSEKMDKVLNNLDKKTLAKNFFIHNKNFTTKLYKNAKSIDICGVVLSSEIDKNIGLFKEKLLNGTSIRILLINSDSKVTRCASLRSDDIENDLYYKKKLEVTFDNINFLFNVIEKSSNPNKGKLEVRLLAYPPSFEIINIQDDKNKNIIIEIYPHHTGYDNPPIFQINNQNDFEWYKYFSEQYEAMWNRALIYKHNKN